MGRRSNLGHKARAQLPVVYACSGCSNIAQLANRVAIDLDRDKHAEMSCIAGVGGGVPTLVKTAKSDRDIIALDGCQLNCVQYCLAQHDVEATHAYTLTDYGIKKRYHQDFDPADVETVKELVLKDITQTSSQRISTNVRFFDAGQSKTLKST